MSCRCGELMRLDAELSGANVLDEPTPHIDDLPDDDDDEATRLITTVPRKLTLSSLGSKPNASSAPRDVRWFVNLDGSHTVEMSTPEVLAARAEGRVSGDALVWRPGMVGWQPVRNVLKAPGSHDAERSAPRAASVAELSPLPPAPRVPSSGSLGPPVPTPPRAPVRSPPAGRDVSPPPAARSTHTSDPSLGVYERGVATIDFEARAARSTPPPPPPKSRAPVPSIPPIRLASSDHRSPTIPPTRSAPRASVPSAPAVVINAPPPAAPAPVVKPMSEPARPAYASQSSEDTAVSRARAARRRIVTVAATAGAAVTLVIAGALVTRAVRGSKRHIESVAAAVPSVTGPARITARAPSEPASVDAPATTDSDDVVSVENLPTSERPEGPRRSLRRSATARAAVTSAAAAGAAPKQRASDQIVLEEEASQPSEAKPAAAATGKADKAAATPATPPPSPPSDALNSPGF